MQMKKFSKKITVLILLFATITLNNTPSLPHQSLEHNIAVCGDEFPLIDLYNIDYSIFS